MRARRKALVAAGVIVVVTLALIDAKVAMHDRLFTAEDAPAKDVAVILGAKPGPLLAQRMDAACALVRAAKVKRLVLTGLAEEMPYMRERAAACGAEVLVDDGATRTLENLKRARDLFGVRDVLVVTQRFHIGRALYLADALGMNAVGVVAEGAPRSTAGRMREHFARLRAVVDVALLE